MTRKIGWMIRSLLAACVCMPLAATAQQSSPFLFPPNDKPEPRPKLDETIYDLLAIGPTSPAGVPAEGLDAGQLLDQVQEAMNASPPRADEALFWLRKMVAASLNDPDRNTPWALRSLAKQLLETDGETKENMRRLEFVWQLLAVTGDGSAMCNLGLKYKDGIGAPKNSRLARQWYERAQKAGCRDAAQALADLGR